MLYILQVVRAVFRGQLVTYSDVPYGVAVATALAQSVHAEGCHFAQLARQEQTRRAQNL